MVKTRFHLNPICLFLYEIVNNDIDSSQRMFNIILPKLLQKNMFSSVSFNFGGFTAIINFVIGI